MKEMSQTRRLGEPPLKVWRLDQASIQASAHRTSHNGLENDAMCSTSQGGGGGVSVDSSRVCDKIGQCDFATLDLFFRTFKSPRIPSIHCRNVKDW